MPHRDPDTGQFVAGDPGRTRDAAYGDFDIQTFRTLANPNSALTSGIATFENWETFEPLGGLTRDELAELVYLDVSVHPKAAPVADEEGHWSTAWEFSLDNDPKAIDHDDSVDTADVDGVSGMDRDTWNIETDPDILDVASASVMAAVDETSGPGAGTAVPYDRTYDFRAMFGRGPVLDRHSDLHVHLESDLSGDGIRGQMSYRLALIWDVFARD